MSPSPAGPTVAGKQVQDEPMEDQSIWDNVEVFCTDVIRDNVTSSYIKTMFQFSVKYN